MDDRPLLVDQPVLRPVAVPVPHARRTACARPSPAHRAARGGELLPAVPARLHLRAAGQRRHPGDVLRRAHQLRQTLQSGTVAAYRAAGDPVGSVPSPAAARPALAAARLVSADRGLCVDHLSASLHRYPHRRAARPALPVAVAARRRQSAAHGADRARTGAPTAGAVLRHRRGRVFRSCNVRRDCAVAMLARRRAADGCAALRDVRCRGFPEGGRWTHLPWHALAAGAVSAGRVDQFAAVDRARSACGAGRQARVAGAHADRCAGARARHRADRRCQRRAVVAHRHPDALRTDARSDRALACTAHGGGRSHRSAAARRWRCAGVLRAGLLAQRGGGRGVAVAHRPRRACR